MTESAENNCLAREGIKLLLNNKIEEAEELFNAENEDVEMAAGYCFLTFMNALMTFEEDKLNESLQTLKNIEKRCSQDVGWLKSMKNKVFGGFTSPDQHVAKKLEEQIILADSQMCVALLMFLQQDLTSYVKGGWVLRKAWKVYQHTYTEILNLYKQTFGCDASIPGSQFPSWQVVTKSISNGSLTATPDSTSKEWSVPNTPSNSTNGFQNPLSYIASFAFPYGGNSSSTGNTSSSSSNNNKINIEPYVVARLMAAVSFGYGIFQLCISLLPSSLLKIIHFLGFEGDRNAGLSALMFSREGNDMRGPLASLALLWYHTIVRPFFALDAFNVQAGVHEAEVLINETEAEFGDSALFLFFKGRVQRLKSNIPQALEAYESAIEKSSQREIQLLCLHEVGWCYLIQLDWGNAFHCFNQLRMKSKWSQSFCTYLTMVCIGAYGDAEFAFRLADELPNLLNEKSGGTQIETFVRRRLKKFSMVKVQEKEASSEASGSEGSPQIDKLSCELFIFELLYFWNALPSCDASNLQKITEVCQSCKNEPMRGLCSLIEGAVYLCMSDFEKAIASFRECLKKRREMKNNKENESDLNTDHISAFALLELATVLVENSQTLEEGKSLLNQVQNDYKNYDFENRLSIRVHAMLKKMN